MKKRIGLVGFGCVGQGFYEIIENKDGYDLEIIKIEVKNKKERSEKNEMFVYKILEILKENYVDVIVELIDDEKVEFKIDKNE